VGKGRAETTEGGDREVVGVCSGNGEVSEERERQMNADIESCIVPFIHRDMEGAESPKRREIDEWLSTE